MNWKCLFIMTTSFAMVSALAQGAEGFNTVTKPWETSNDPVAQMWQRWETGKSRLDTSTDKAFIASVLKELNVPVASQVLVFSKTSLQNSLISPQTPRAIYFNEECYCGWARGGMMELIGMDPEKGPQFYALSFSGKEKPELLTTDNCLSCHESARTNNVKGLLVRSVYAADDGQPILHQGSFVSGHESPLSERWGGWYVTGKHGNERHMGNVIASSNGDQIVLDREKGANILSLDRFFSTKPYLVQTSDIVALMVLEHQCTMHNKLTEASKSTREAMIRQHELQKAFGEAVTDIPQGSAATVIKSHADKVVKHLLFFEEYPLKDGGIEGTAAYQEAFGKTERGTKDGRSLKQFQLLTRLFKYRCSYMIYSKSFAAMPQQLKDEVYLRLWKVLSNEDTSADFAYLSLSERAHLLEILLETKQDLPSYWHGVKKVAS